MNKDVMKATGKEIMEFLEKNAPLKAEQFKRNGFITQADVMEVVYELLGLDGRYTQLDNTCGWVYHEEPITIDFSNHEPEETESNKEYLDKVAKTASTLQEIYMDQHNQLENITYHLNAAQKALDRYKKKVEEMRHGNY